MRGNLIMESSRWSKVNQRLKAINTLSLTLITAINSDRRIVFTFPGQEAAHTLKLLMHILYRFHWLSSRWSKVNQRLKAINTLSLTLITQACETYLIQNSRPEPQALSTTSLSPWATQSCIRRY
jgi:uncharacterized membrane protein YccC